MLVFTYQLASVLIFLPLCAIGQIVQNNWIFPVGTDPDFQQTFINNDILEVSWEGWNSSIRTQYFEEESMTADLWVTSYNFALSPFSQLLSRNIDVTGSGSYTWTVNIDSKSLSISAEYVLRFTTPGKNYSNIFIGVPNIPSPGFVVLGRPSAVASSSVPTSVLPKQSPTTVSRSSSSNNPVSTTSNTLTQSSTSTVVTTTSSTALASTSAVTSIPMLTSAIALAVASTPTPTSVTRIATGLKTSALVGAVVGSVIGGIIATVLLVLVFRRYWSNTSPPPPAYESNDYYDIPLCPRTPSLTELPSALPEFSSKWNVPELPAISRSIR